MIKLTGVRVHAGQRMLCVDFSLEESGNWHSSVEVPEGAFLGRLELLRLTENRDVTDEDQQKVLKQIVDEIREKRKKVPDVPTYAKLVGVDLEAAKEIEKG